jgi:hypothetical protein
LQIKFTIVCTLEDEEEEKKAKNTKIVQHHNRKMKNKIHENIEFKIKELLGHPKAL